MRSPLPAPGKEGRRRPQRSQRGKQRGGCSHRPDNYGVDDDDDEVDNDDDDFDSDDDGDGIDDDVDDDGDEEVKYIREAETEEQTNASHTGKSITHFHPFHLQNIMCKITKSLLCASKKMYQQTRSPPLPYMMMIN